MTTDFTNPKIRDILCYGPFWWFEGKERSPELTAAAEHCLVMGYVTKDSWPYDNKVVIRYTVTALGTKAIDAYDAELNEKFAEIYRNLDKKD